MTAPAPVPDGTTPPAEAVEAAMRELGCAREYGDADFQTNPAYCAEHVAMFGDHVLWTDDGCPIAVSVAAAVVAALRLPERDRETAARFRVAAELTIQDVRAQRGDHIAGLVEDSFAAHFARASALREGRADG